MTNDVIVYIVDDDEAVRDFLTTLIESIDLRVEAHASASEFLAAYKPDSPGCLLLDVRMPGMSGLELQRKLAERSIDLQVIILTGHGNVQVAVQAMMAGAVDFIEKPFNNELLLDRVQKAVSQSLLLRIERQKHDEILRLLATLMPRERQVFDLVVTGKLNKTIAHHLSLSEKTVEIHRANVMNKMQADSLASLIRMAVNLSQD